MKRRLEIFCKLLRGPLKHQQKFAGGLPAPRLACQSYEYLVEAMRAFADGDRTNNADMVKIMQNSRRPSGRRSRSIYRACDRSRSAGVRPPPSL